MRIECRFCHYEYDANLYGTCPQCGKQNAMFRSAAAARLISGNESEGYFNPERRERLRVPDQFGSKSTVGRVKPYLKILVLMCAIVMLGNIMMKFANDANEQKESQNVPLFSAQKYPAELTDADIPPILERASAAFSVGFEAVCGSKFDVTCTGILNETKELKPITEDGDQIIFVNIYATVTDRKKFDNADPPIPYIIIDEEKYNAVELGKAALSAVYTAFDYAALKRDGSVSGQFFFITPIDMTEFTLHYDDAKSGQKQELQLHL